MLLVYQLHWKVKYTFQCVVYHIEYTCGSVYTFRLQLQHWNAEKFRNAVVIAVFSMVCNIKMFFCFFLWSYLDISQYFDNEKTSYRPSGNIKPADISRTSKVKCLLNKAFNRFQYMYHPISSDMHSQTNFFWICMHSLFRFLLISDVNFMYIEIFEIHWHVWYLLKEYV